MNGKIIIELLLTLFTVILQVRIALPQVKSWMLGPFSKADSINPILMPDMNSKFFCPERQSEVNWEAKDVFNPAAVVKDGKVYLLYRAEDKIGKPAGTSRIGIAWSNDGVHFTKDTTPILYPENDFMKKYEWEGGCEDPRIVEDDKGNFIMTYTSYDGMLARLSVASSKDLIHWKKQGLAFSKAYNGKYINFWSKSGSIVCRLKDNNLVAEKIKGKYWMFWGDNNIYLASSTNLLDWTPVEFEGDTVNNDLPDYASGMRKLKPVFGPRNGKFDSRLVEPGPPAIITDSGILLIYNGANRNDQSLPRGTYSGGQILFDINNFFHVLNRSGSCFFKPERSYELSGQVNNVCFLEGLVYFKNLWFLYYGTADSKIAVAVSHPD